MYPCARHDELLVEELPDELLVYDLQRDKAHCLNKTAAFVWRQCDGLTPVGDIARSLPVLGLPADEEVVWLALEQLERIHLLRKDFAPARQEHAISRRKVIQRLGVAGGVGVLLPVINSITAPAAAQTASPIPTSTTRRIPCDSTGTDNPCGCNANDRPGCRDRPGTPCDPGEECVRAPHPDPDKAAMGIQTCVCGPPPK
jgi:hypothetical protein